MSLKDTLGTNYALVFPGQGSQEVGMGKDLADASDAAREIIEHADAVLDLPLSRLYFEGPEDDLNETFNAQPAIFTVGVAALRALEAKAAEEDIQLSPMMVAGHSLGLFTALVAAEVIEFGEALKLVRQRGRLMRQAGEANPGGMTAVIGMDDDTVAQLVEQAAEGDVLTVANRNCPGQIVVSGEAPALDRFEARAKEAGARKIARLPITIASHSSLMSSATQGLNEIIDTLTLHQPRIPVVANTTGERLNTAEDIREELRFHVERGVDWTGSIRMMIDADITTFVELGHGSVLSGLNRRIDRATTTLTLKDFGLPPA